MSRTIASVKRPSKHQYIPDPSLGEDYLGHLRCATCGMPRNHARHDLPDTSEAAAEDRRRLGEHND